MASETIFAAIDNGRSLWRVRRRLPAAPLVAALPQAVQALLAVVQGGPGHGDGRQARVVDALAALLKKALLSRSPAADGSSGDLAVSAPGRCLLACPCSTQHLDTTLHC